MPLLAQPGGSNNPALRSIKISGKLDGQMGSTFDHMLLWLKHEDSSITSMQPPCYWELYCMHKKKSSCLAERASEAQGNEEYHRNLSSYE